MRYEVSALFMSTGNGASDVRKYIVSAFVLRNAFSSKLYSLSQVIGWIKCNLEIFTFMSWPNLSVSGVSTISMVFDMKFSSSGSL